MIVSWKIYDIMGGTMKLGRAPLVSIIVPVYNESARLGGIVDICKYLQQQKYASELVIVDDGSLDGTLVDLQKIIKNLAQPLAKFPKTSVRILTYTPNRGKGLAIKQGMLAARGKFCVFVDVDLSTPIATVGAVLQQLKKTPIAIGSRRALGANLLIHQSWTRESMGRVFTWLSQLVLDIAVSDFTCGCKGFTKSAVEIIFRRCKIERWSIDPEALYIAKLHKLAIAEVPVTWKNDPRTRVRFPQDLIRSLTELFVIRVYGLTGRYD